MCCTNFALAPFLVLFGSYCRCWGKRVNKKIFLLFKGHPVDFSYKQAHSYFYIHQNTLCEFFRPNSHVELISFLKNIYKYFCHVLSLQFARETIFEWHA